MVHRRIFASVAVAAALMAGACSASDDEVRSDAGPDVAEEEEEGTDESTDSGDGGDESAATTTTAPAPSGPATSPNLATVGNVQIPDGEPGQLSVVLVGPADGDSSTAPVVVRNRTGKTIYDIEASATARGADGALAGSGSSQGFAPTAVGDGEWAFGYVYFSNDMPDGATFDVTATGEDDAGFISSVDVRPAELNKVPGQYSDEQIVGIVANESGADVSGPVSVMAACFDEAGTTILDVVTDYTDADTIAADGTASFAIDLFETPCPVYAVGASGYDM